MPVPFHGIGTMVAVAALDDSESLAFPISGSHNRQTEFVCQGAICHKAFKMLFSRCLRVASPTREPDSLSSHSDLLRQWHLF